LSVTRVSGASPNFCQFAHQFHSRSLIAPSLYEEVEASPSSLNRVPQPELLAGDHQCHFVEMPPRRRLGASTAKLSGETEARTSRPAVA
jgi:hypothetical protein